MIETTILTYLKSKLDVPVLMEVPTSDPMPDRFVTIEKVGSTRKDHVVCDSIAFQSHSLTRLYDAAMLDEAVRQAVDEMPAETSVGSVYLASNYNHTDMRTKRYRYQCVYEIYHIGG